MTVSLLSLRGANGVSDEAISYTIRNTVVGLLRRPSLGSGLLAMTEALYFVSGIWYLVFGIQQFSNVAI